MRQLYALLIAFVLSAANLDSANAAPPAQLTPDTSSRLTAPTLHLTFGEGVSALRTACGEADCMIGVADGKYLRQDAVRLQLDSRIPLGELDNLGLRGQSFTILTRVKLDDVGRGVQRVLGTGDFVLGLLEGRPYMNFGQNGLTGQTKLLAHKWYELGWRYDAGRGEMSVLVDGMAEKIVAGRPSLQRSGPLMLGADPPFTGIPGVVDDLRIYNLPLTGAELVVLQQMDAGSRAASPDAPTSARVRPMTVSIGCIPSDTTIPRSYFEEAIRHYADAVYEMTEGLHRLGRVEIYTNKESRGRPNH